MSEMNESFYACPALKKFPIDSPEAVQDSFNSWNVQKQKFSAEQNNVIGANFTKAASYYNIELEEPTEKPTEREVLMFKGASENVNMNEITNIDELNKAADFIIEKRASVQREVLAEPAKYVLWQASNADIDTNTEKFRKIAHIAGIGVGDRDKIQREFYKRASNQVLGTEGQQALWKYAKEVENLTENEFFDEKNLNTMCNVLDNVDFQLGNQHKRASEGYPEDIVFADTIDDMIKSASDLYYVPSIDATLSKTATFERENVINNFFASHFANKEPLEGEALINKVASLDSVTATALLELLDE